MTMDLHMNNLTPQITGTFEALAFLHFYNIWEFISQK